MSKSPGKPLQWARKRQSVRDGPFSPAGGGAGVVWGSLKRDDEGEEGGLSYTTARSTKLAEGA